METVHKQLFDFFSSFIRDLSKTYREIKSCLYRNYEDCLVVENCVNFSEFPKIGKFLSVIKEHEKMIIDKNLDFFDLEIEILEEISFKRLWEKNISNKTRENIWKYLQTFQIININLESSVKLKEAINQINNDEEVELDRDTAKDLNKLKKLSENVQDPVINNGNENEIDQMLGGLMNTGIGDIAKEVAQTLDMETMFKGVDQDSNPMDIVTQIMNPDKMGEIFKNINSIMEAKMESGDLNEDQLKNDAMNAMGIMGDNPMFKGMMEQMNKNKPE